MAIELKVPTVGESITEVQIGQWLKDEGQLADKDENLVEIETDKATVEISAPIAGTISKVLKRSGETAAVGEVIGYMEPAAVGQASGVSKRDNQLAAAAQAQAAETIQTAAKPKGDGAPRSPEPAVERAQSAPHPVTQAQPVAKPQQPSKPAPAAKSELVVSPKSPRLIPRGREMQKTKPQPPTPQAARGAREEEAVPMSPIRRRIAQRLVEAQHSGALLTTFNEIDMSAVISLRNEHKQVFQDKYGIKLGFMSFFVKAAIDALKLVPQVNAEIRGNDIVYHNYYDIGIAVGGGK